MAKRKKDPAKAAAKWARRIQDSQQEMIEGVGAVAEAPGAAAVKKQATMKARLIAAIESGKWAKKTGDVSLGDWQESMQKIGIPRAVQGSQEKQGKFADRLAPVLDYQENLKRTIAAMPNATPADRKARMTAWFDGMSKYGKNK